ncbi:MAG TPA: bifunctional DNA-formamidopyrimidine glycosylase/DNA-(apurinic or apyrimidinic site) lyase [Acidimicrobiales bacterium]|nr:bifunctional DNA-formamidopyrimidine glycosylase/DNA-(apurinic or apyrimidinic site) lyase [Acidimicrobiales bacterium]
MPELPEVETIRRDLDKQFLGKRIKAVEVTGSRTLRRHNDPGEFVARLEGRKLAATLRRGKYLLLRLDSGDVVVVHLGMSGQLLRADPREPVPKHTHVIVTFAGAGQLRFVDPRTFGEMFVTVPAALEEEVPELAHLGFDPLEEQMAWTSFGALLSARKTRLKPLLMDQRFIAGIGNMYADEILFNAGLRHDRGSESLTPQEVRRLYRAMVETLQDAIKHRGSSLADEQYRDLFGEVGEYQRLHNVYDREGEACPRCRSTIVRLKANGRSTFYCDHCQV